MSAEWNDHMLDDILSDVERMTRERGEAEADADRPLHNWSLGEVDALLDEDNALAGLAHYEIEPEFPFETELEKRAQPEQADAPEPELPEPEPITVETIEPEAVEPEAAAPETAEPEPQAPQTQPRGNAAFGRLFSHKRRKENRPQLVQAEDETPVIPVETEPEEPAETVEPTAGTEPAEPIEAVEEQAMPEPIELAQPIEPDEAAAEADDKTREAKTRVLDKMIEVPKMPRPKPQPKQKPDPEMVDGQMKLSGFDEEDDVEQVDEAEAEKELNERRKTQVKQFKLYDFAEKYEPDLPAKTDVFEPEPEPSAQTEDTDADENEYVRLSDRMRIGRILQEDRRNTFFSVCVVGVATVILIVLSILSDSAGQDTRPIFTAVSLVLTSLSAAVSITTLRKGGADILRLQPSCDSAALAAMSAALIQGVVSIILPAAVPASGTFCAAAVFSLLLCRIARLFETVATVGNFKFCAFAAADHLYAVRGFDRESDAFEIGKSLQVKHPKLRFSQQTRFPAQFRKYSDFRSVLDRICKILLPVGFAAALIMAVAGWFKAGDEVGVSGAFAGALFAFTGALCVVLPAGAAFTVSVPLGLLMQDLNRHGGMIASPEAARENAGVHGVAVDTTDLYDRQRTDVYCFQDYGTLHFDAMYLYAAALAIGAHSPAEGAFLHAVGNPDILPPVQSLIYEERLGVSATINRQKVLLGSRNLLASHSIDPPPKSGEVPYIQQNKRVLYLAVDGKVAGMFVIDYVQKKALSVPMRILQDNDTNLLVYAPDCNVTEDFISASFRLRKGGVRLLDPAAGDLLRERLAEQTEHMPATALHNGSTESLLRTLADAAVMQNIQRVAAFIGVIGCAIGWLVSFILLLVKGAGAMNWIFATVYPAVWMVLSSALGVWQARKAMKK